jgi:glucan biosynthesis protein C
MSTSVLRPGERLIHLDALRAFCMFYGILSHGATLDHNGMAFFDMIKLSSDLFRMATFFLVAGFFTGMVATRSGIAAYVRGRVILIVVPLVTSLVTLMPITNYLIHTWHNGPMTLRHYFLEGGYAEPSLGKDVWHLQLWFLFSLFAYAMLTPLLLGLMRRPAVTRLIDGYVTVTGRWTLWATVLVIAVSVLVMRAIDVTVAEPLLRDTRMWFIAKATLTYLPYFILGLAMFISPGLFRAMHRISWIGLALSLTLFLVARHGGFEMPVMVNRLMLWIGRAGTITFLMAALLRIFELYFNKPSRFLNLCVAGAFTFYLFHVTGIYVVAHLVDSWFRLDVPVVFAIVVVTVPPLMLALHAYVIAPSPTLRLLYNGRLPDPARRAIAPT